jgi:Rrf2 family protein
MLFTVATGYALQALAHMPEDGSFMMAKDLAEQLHLPAPYLAKILQNLARAEILESVRGPKGGFRLTKPAHRVSVGEILAAIEGPGSLDRCIMGFPACDCENPCPMHDAWSAVKTQVEVSMTSTTLRDLQLTKVRRSHLYMPGATRRSRS